MFLTLKSDVFNRRSMGPSWMVFWLSYDSKMKNAICPPNLRVLGPFLGVLGPFLGVFNPEK